MEKQRDISVKSVVSYQIQTTKRTVGPLKLTIKLNGNGELSLHPQDRKNCEGAPSASSMLVTRAVGWVRLCMQGSRRSWR